MSYCSKCGTRSNWVEHSDFWQCYGCGRKTIKRTDEELQQDLEQIQEDWSRLEKSDFLKNPKNKSIVEPLMTLADQTLYHLRLINGDINGDEAI